MFIQCSDFLSECLDFLKSLLSAQVLSTEQTFLSLSLSFPPFFFFYFAHMVGFPSCSLSSCSACVSSPVRTFMDAVQHSQTPELWGSPYIGFPFLLLLFYFTLFYLFVARKLEETCSFSAAHGRICFSLRWNNGLRFEDQIWNGNSDCTRPGELQRAGAEHGW